jgi:transposase-like protein
MAGVYNRPVASPEYKYQPRELYAPVEKTGAPSTDLPEPEPSRKILGFENSISEPIQPGEGGGTTPLEQSAVLATGKQEASGTVFKFIEKEENESGLQRRLFGERSGSIPPLAGGSPKRINLPIDEIVADYRDKVRVEEIAKRYGVTPVTIYKRLHEVGIRTHLYKPRQKETFEVPVEETARKRIEEILSTAWDRKTYEDKKQHRIAMRELAVLEQHYREIFEEVWTRLFVNSRG